MQSKHIIWIVAWSKAMLYKGIKEVTSKRVEWDGWGDEVAGKQGTDGGQGAEHTRGPGVQLAVVTDQAGGQTLYIGG